MINGPTHDPVPIWGYPGEWTEVQNACEHVVSSLLLFRSCDGATCTCTNIPGHAAVHPLDMVWLGLLGELKVSTLVIVLRHLSHECGPSTLLRVNQPDQGVGGRKVVNHQLQN